MSDWLQNNVGTHTYVSTYYMDVIRLLLQSADLTI